ASVDCRIQRGNGDLVLVNLGTRRVAVVERDVPVPAALTDAATQPTDRLPGAGDVGVQTRAETGKARAEVPATVGIAGKERVGAEGDPEWIERCIRRNDQAVVGADRRRRILAR